MSTADRLQQLRLERQKSDLSHKLEELQVQLERSQNEKSNLAEESGNKIKQALSLLNTARQEIDKLQKEKTDLAKETTDLRRENEELKMRNTELENAAEAHKTSTAENGSSFKKEDGLSALNSKVGKEEGFSALQNRRVSAVGGMRTFRRESRHDLNINPSSVRRKTRQEEKEEKPMSMAERMSMFEGKGGGRNFGGSNACGGNAPKKSWRDAPPQVKLSDDTADKKEKDAVLLRPNKVPRDTTRDASRHTMPPNLYSQKDVQEKGSTPDSPDSPADTGKAKLNRAMGGMMAAIEAEKRQKGIAPKPASGFLGLVNTVAPKNPVKRAQSAPGGAASKKQALLYWCQRMTEGHAHVEIKNFSSSWNNGMAFCALFHHFVPDQIPYETLDPKNREFNFTMAFREGEKAGVTALLDVEDMVDMKNPDWMSVMTYISLIYNHFNGIRVGGPRLPPMPGQE